MFENFNQVIDQLNEFGLIVDQGNIQVDTNKPIRCKADMNTWGGRKGEKKGWFHLASFVADRKTYIVGAYGVWQGTDNNRQKIELGKIIELTPEQKKQQAARHREMAKKAKEERQAEIEAASARAQLIWSKYTREGHCDYLDRKGVKAHGVRFDPKGFGTMAIPMADSRGKIYGLQLIRSDSAIKGTNKIQKKFEPKGMAMMGHYHMIGAPSGVVIIAEGYATAATIYEVTGHAVAVAFNANNIKPVAQELRKQYPNITIIVAADDDYIQKCTHCKKPTLVENPKCEHCGEDHLKTNPGIEAAEQVVNIVGGRMVVPNFQDENGNDIRNREKLTDFNDLAMHSQGGTHLVRAQIEQAMQGLNIKQKPATVAPTTVKGEGETRPEALSIMPIEDIVERFIYVDDDAGETCFDDWTKTLVKTNKVKSLLPAKARWEEIKAHPLWMSRAVYLDQVGFDPTEKDQNIKCNMFNGWPTKPKEGSCENLLALAFYLCSKEDDPEALFKWLLKWLAYPLQNPGAKMQSAVVVHGPQGTGKSRFFEAYAKIYGEYSIILNQGAIEDKFNSDWTSKKLFVVADEVVASQEKYHLKNQLKGLITGEWIRVNPKNVAAHKERNQMNLVFLSNEKQPVVLENDDRRHCVMWTPEKMSESNYETISHEIENGGIEALHHYLLNLDLKDFKPWTKPPMTKSKRQLININQDTVDAFIDDWITTGCGLSIAFPVGPVMSSDLYDIYKMWCKRNGENFPRSSKIFNAHIDKMPGWFRGFKTRYENMNYQQSKRARVIIPSDVSMVKAKEEGVDATEKQADQTESQWITDSCVAFEHQKEKL